MEKNTKILLGVGAVIAAYLIFKPKKVSATESIPPSSEMGDTVGSIKKHYEDLNAYFKSKVAPIDGKCPIGYYKEEIRCIAAPCPEGMCVPLALES